MIKDLYPKQAYGQQTRNKQTCNFQNMKNLLQYLDNNEKDKFSKFIRSPYFNSRAQLIELYDILTAETASSIDNKKLFKKLFSGETYNDIRTRKLISDFNKLFEKFIAYHSITKWDPYVLNTNLLETLQFKAMESNFISAYKSISSEMRGKIFKDDSYYRSLSRIELLNYYSLYYKYEKRSVESLRKASEFMDLAFIYSKLHLARDIITHKSFNREDFGKEITFFREIIEYIEASRKLIMKEHPDLYIIFLTVKNSIENNDQIISELNDYIRKNEKNMDRYRLGYYYLYLTSMHWIKINSGNIEYFQPLIKLYKHLESIDLIKLESYIQHDIFNSIVMAALNTKEIAWLEKFLEKNIINIEPGYRSDVYNLNKAKLLFEKSEYNSVLQRLNSVEFRDPNYYINAKTILIKTLYEMGDTEGILFTLDSFKHYANRNTKLVSSQINNIKMLVKYFKMLIKLKPGDTFNINKFLELLSKEKMFVPQRIWLSGKAELLLDNSGFSLKD